MFQHLEGDLMRLGKLAVLCATQILLAATTLVFSQPRPVAVRPEPTPLPARNFNFRTTPPKELITPSQVYEAAFKDAQAIIDDSVRHKMRYLSIYNVHPDDRIYYIKLLNFVCNSLSRRRTMIYLSVVPDTDNSPSRS